MDIFEISTQIQNKQRELKNLIDKNEQSEIIQEINRLKQAIPETEACLKQLKKKQINQQQKLELKIETHRIKLDNKIWHLSENTYPAPLLSSPWSDKIWISSDVEENRYKPKLAGFPPKILRIGEIQQIEQLSLEEKTIPALVPTKHLVIYSNNPKSRQLALEAIQSIALRIISTFPLRQLKAIFLDPVSMGNNFPFNKLPDFISGLKTYTRGDEIREELRGLTIHIEQVIQNYLGITYSSIEEYNTAKSSVAEPYRYLFMADFPTNFDRSSWEDLKSLLLNGPKAGVYVVIHVDTTLDKPQREIDYRLFDSYCTVLQPNHDSNRFTMQFPQQLNCQIVLDQPPPNQQFNQLIDAIAKSFKEVKTETLPFTEFYPQKTNPGQLEWSESYDSRQEIRAPIGVMGAMERLEFWMGTNDEGLIISQALLAGKPGAGKSYTLHGIIISLAMRYSPDELEMYLLDFKEGVEFQMYVDPERSETANFNEDLNEEKALPHAKVVSIESDREFGLSVLRSVQTEIEMRGSRFKSVGVTNVNDYRNRCPQEKMPRILVVIDEFQYLFLENDSISSELNVIFNDITRRGRAFGVHLLLASQSPNVTNMSRGIYSFIELRMAQQMDKTTAGFILAEGNIDSVELLDKPGKLIYNKSFGSKGHNEIGQVADISPQERTKALLHIQSIVSDRNYQRPEPLILFNGARLTQLKNNRQLVQLSQMDRWLSLKELNKQMIKEPDWLVEETPGVAWLGEAMRIGEHTKAIFRKRSRSNLLIIASSETTAFGLISGILLSLVHTYQPQQAQFKIIDLSQDSEENDWSTLSLNFQRLFNAYFPINIGKRFPDSGQKVSRATDILAEVYQELERRKQQRAENPDEINFGPSLFFIYAIGGLNRAQNLRPEEGNRGEQLSKDAEKLIALIAQGSELGIHTILWLDNLKTWSQLNANKTSGLTAFDLRVGTKMLADDSRNLLGETFAQNLPSVMAYFCDKGTGGNLQKFKPYAVPSFEFMAEYSKGFQNRSI